MVKLNYAHLCDHASLSKDGKVNILGVFRNINALNFPAIHSQMYVVTNVSVDESRNYVQVINLIKEDSPDEIIASARANMEATSGELNLGFLGKFNNIRFETPGRYKFQIYVDNDLIEEVPLRLDLLPG